MRKKIKILAIMFSALFLITPTFATELEQTQVEDYQYQSEEAKRLKEVYEKLISELYDEYFEGNITQEEFESTLEQYETSQKKDMDKAEEKWLKEQHMATLPEVDYTIDHKDVYDEDGNKITDFTNVNIEEISSKKTITFEGILEPGTKVSDNYAIHVQVSAENFIFTQVNTLEKSNNYKCEILVPNDTYVVTLTSNSTEDTIIFEDNYITAEDNPVLKVYIVGATRIITNEDDIISIEGGEYIEENPVEKNNVNMFKLIFGIFFGAGIIGLVIYAIKKKKELEL